MVAELETFNKQAVQGSACTEGKNATYYAAGHQSALSKSCQDIAGMVLVVRYPGQSCVKGHHEQGELQEGPEQTGTSPSEAGLQVQLEGGDKRTDTK